MDTAAPDQGLDTLDDSPISDAELDALAGPSPPADDAPLDDAELDELVKPPAEQPFEQREDVAAFNTIADKFPSDAELLEAVAGTDPAMRARVTRDMGSGVDLRVNLTYAAAAYRQLATPDVLAALDKAGMLDDPRLLTLASKIGRRLASEAGSPSTFTAESLMSEAQPKPTREQKDRITAAIDAIYEKNRGKPSMGSPEVQRQLQRLFKAKTAGGPAA